MPEGSSHEATKAELDEAIARAERQLALLRLAVADRVGRRGQ